MSKQTLTPEAALSTNVSSGIVEMDQLHFDFFGALSELSALPDEEFAAGFSRFVRYAEQAFAWEEQWMLEDSDFSADKSHREQHARVLGALHHVHSRVLDGDLATGRETAETLLPQWFAFHISTMDMALAASMQMNDLAHLHKQTMPQATMLQ
jgi:hemerythrin-like metal-binding protein